MWKLLILLIAVSAAADDEDTGDNEDADYAVGCRVEIDEKCSDDDRPRDFPGTEAELEEFCKFALKYFGCIAALTDRCDEDDADFAQLFQEMNENAIRICDKGSLLYSALVETLPCFKKMPGIVMMPCHGRLQNEHLEAFSESLSSNGITDLIDSDSESEDCLTALYATGCFATHSGIACGDVARDVVTDIILGFDLPFKKCRPGVKEHIPSIVRMMQLEAEKQGHVENAIKKRK